MPAKKQQIVCYDAGTTIKKSEILCPVCGSVKEILWKDVPEIKTIIIECCGLNEKYLKR